MDPVGRALDEYGTVSVSSPLFADAKKVQESDGFGFDLTTGPDDYFKIAREEVQGAVATFHQRAAETRGGLQIRSNVQNLVENKMLMRGYEDDLAAFQRKRMLNDSSKLMGLLIPLIDPQLKFVEPAPIPGEVPTLPEELPATDADSPPAPAPPAGTEVAASDAPPPTDSAPTTPPAPLTPEDERTARIRELITALSGASTGVSGSDQRPAVPEFKNELPQVDPNVMGNTDLVKQVIASDKLANFQALLKDLGTPPPKISARSAILTASGDTMVESIMRFLGHPVLTDDWKDKIVLMGVSMVSVAPGSRTMRGYVADVSVTCTYTYQPARPAVLKALLDSRDRYTDVLLEAITNNYKEKNPAIMIAWKEVRELKQIIDIKKDQIHERRTAGTSTDELESELSAMEGNLAGIEERLAELLYPPDAHAAVIRTGTAGRKICNLYQPTFTGSWQLAVAANSVRNPVVSAASPMTETQTLDLATSIREQQAFAFKLALVVAGFGSEAQAQGMFQYIERLEQDAATRTAMNTVAAYSNSGGVFGYQIGPSLVGIADFLPGGFSGGAAGTLQWLWRGSYRPGPDYTLQRQSFPALVFVGMNKDDLRLMVQCDDARENCYIVEPSLEFHQTSRWIPVPHSEADRCREPRPAITESQRVQWAYGLGKARQLSEELDDGKYGDLRDYIDYRSQTLAAHALHAYSYQTIPVELLLAVP